MIRAQSGDGQIFLAFSKRKWPWRRRISKLGVIDFVLGNSGCQRILKGEERSEQALRTDKRRMEARERKREREREKERK